MKPDVSRYVRPCKPDHAVLTDASEREREVMEELGFCRTDASGLEVHVRTWPVGDE